MHITLPYIRMWKKRNKRKLDVVMKALLCFNTAAACEGEWPLNWPLCKKLAQDFSFIKEVQEHIIFKRAPSG